MLRASFWVGAIVDLLAALQLLVPGLWVSMGGFPAAEANGTLTYALIVAGSLMLGWTGLLVWANRKPLERKSILLLTVCPVLLGLALDNMAAILSGLKTAGSTIPLLLIQVVVGTFMLFSYMNARKLIP